MSDTNVGYRRSGRAMRDLHGSDGHGEHRRRARDAAAGTHAGHACDGPKHAANDVLKLRMLLDPEARKKAHLDYQKTAAAEAPAGYTARHAKFSPGDQAGAIEMFKSGELKPEQAPPEARDQPARAIRKRRDSPGGQRQEQTHREHSRLPSNEATAFAVSVSSLLSLVAETANVIPVRAEGIVGGSLAAVLAGVAWGNRRWKDKHGDRSKD
jgi:hypothetical protein